MSTPEQPDAPALTRKQMREIRNTGATPIVTADSMPTPADTAPESSADEATTDISSEEPVAEIEPPAVIAPRPRAAQPVIMNDTPMSDASVDLGVSALTRRQARQQERIRTASVPVITPDVAAAHADFATDDVRQMFEPVKVERATVDPQLGAGLLAGKVAEVDLPPSFDQLITRSMTGAVGTGNALILSQTPSATNLVAPLTATGEVLITGTLNLPEGLGSTGHAIGTADSKETDAVLIDGELPAHSSPTPIAASAAISTVKNSGDIIKPPVPEKGGRLMMTLAITAGVLALALVGVLILAFVTGVF